MHEVPGEDHSTWKPDQHSILPDDVLNRVRARRDKQRNIDTEKLDPDYEARVRKNFEGSHSSVYQTNPGFKLEDLDKGIPPTIKVGSEDIPDTIPQFEISNKANNEYMTTPEINPVEYASVLIEELEELSEKYGIDILARPVNEDDLRAENPKITNRSLTQVVIKLNQLDQALDRMTNSELLSLTRKYPNFNPAKVDSIFRTNSQIMRRNSGDLSGD